MTSLSDLKIKVDVEVDASALRKSIACELRRIADDVEKGVDSAALLSLLNKTETLPSLRLGK